MPGSNGEAGFLVVGGAHRGRNRPADGSSHTSAARAKRTAPCPKGRAADGTPPPGWTRQSRAMSGGLCHRLDRDASTHRPTRGRLRVHGGADSRWSSGDAGSAPRSASRNRASAVVAFVPSSLRPTSIRSRRLIAVAATHPPVPDPLVGRRVQPANRRAASRSDAGDPQIDSVAHGIICPPKLKTSRFQYGIVHFIGSSRVREATTTTSLPRNGGR